MNLYTLIGWKGCIKIADRFVSARIIREEIEKKYNILILRESKNQLLYVIKRYWRLYGGPWIFFPQARILIYIEKVDNSYILKWFILWPEYILLLSLILVGLYAFSISGRNMYDLSGILITFSFPGTIILADIYMTYVKIKNIFIKLED